MKDRSCRAVGDRAKRKERAECGGCYGRRFCEEEWGGAEERVGPLKSSREGAEAAVEGDPGGGSGGLYGSDRGGEERSGLVGVVCGVAEGNRKGEERDGSWRSGDGSDGGRGGSSGAGGSSGNSSRTFCGKSGKEGRVEGDGAGGKGSGEGGGKECLVADQ